METQKTGRKIGLNPGDLPEKRETGKIGGKAEPKARRVPDSEELKRLREVQDFLESRGFKTHPHPLNERKKGFAGNAHDEIVFCLTNSLSKGFTFLWAGGNHRTDQDWYEDRNTTISKLFPGSYVTGPNQGRVECRLFIPVDQEHYRESVLNIIEKTRSTMGY
jgi:hypothetical protein